MFEPPCCPYPECEYHLEPAERFYLRHGSYRPKCRPWPVPRFRCLGCGRTYSRQTFRADYCDHRPDLNARLYDYLTSGVGLRQSARKLKLSLSCTQLKFRKICRHLRGLNANIRGPLLEGSIFQLDEFETYEGRRNTRPLTVPVLIERDSRFVVWCESAPIRPRGKMTPARIRAIEADEARFGPREDRSHEAIARTLARGRELVGKVWEVRLETDEKTAYGPLARQAFEGKTLLHETTSSKLARMTWNPLFPINHTEAIMRDLMGRLRRESWLVSKMGKYLDLALQMWMTDRNLVKRRFNFDPASPAETLGFTSRRWTVQEVLGWRQDWGERSVHPLARGRVRTVAEERVRGAA